MTARLADIFPVKSNNKGCFLSSSWQEFSWILQSVAACEGDGVHIVLGVKGSWNYLLALGLSNHIPCFVFF